MSNWNEDVEVEMPEPIEILATEGLTLTLELKRFIVDVKQVLVGKRREKCNELFSAVCRFEQIINKIGEENCI